MNGSNGSFFSFFRWFSSFKLLWKTFGGSFVFLASCLFLEERIQELKMLPHREKLFTYRFCKVSNSGIGYRRALIDLRRSQLLQTFLLLDRLLFEVLKRVEFL
ncbi:hypothetical protein RhiirA5_440997 [Rhizophagus irregularis]|uniref:Uncharacterized protein n=1 Tax=Rhizophagus irregularis TaxID=588596 RepID=A0A2N0NG23_9GLOM|nr:hypothetical protein RhiirA5_440997 [Rhizophagus irregularis]